MFQTSTTARQPSLEELAQFASRPPNESAINSPDMGDIRSHDVALGQLNARGFVQFHPSLAQRLNSFKAAIFLGHALSWSRYLAKAQPQRRGWFFMTAIQWREATGLSTYEQTSARNELVQRGLLEEALAGRPAVLHYRVNLPATAAFLGLDQLTWESMSELFRSCIRFYKPLSDICGNVSTGLYLSFLLQRQSYALRNPLIESATVELFPGEFSYRPDQARIALCLGIKAQRNAREKLKLAGFIREGRASNEVVATRVNLSAIASCLQAQDKPARKRTARQAAAPMALVRQPTIKPSKPPKTSGRTAGLSRSTLPQRQLHLFAAMGLTARAPGSDELAPDTTRTTIAPNTSTDQLAQTLFAASLFARASESKEPAATPLPPAANIPELSTGAAAPAGEFAFFKNPICPFLNANLPFFENYKEQGISRYLQTTTTPPVDNLAGDAESRRRLENSEKSETETVANQKIDSNDPNRAIGGGLMSCQWGGGVTIEKTPVGPENRSDDSGGECLDVPIQLILPEKLDQSHHAGVLATVGQAPKDLQQAFIDELAGHLAIPGKTIHNPAGWLHGLIRRHQDGSVALALAPQVAEQRARHQRYLERLTSPMPTAPSPFAKPHSAASELIGVESEVQRTERQRLKALRASFGGRRRGAL